MKRIANFEKVSFNQFKESIDKSTMSFTDESIESLYNSIILPQRATRGSAGYDFFLPFNIKLDVGESIIIPSGIKVNITDGWVLLIFPRSGFGFKYRLQLDNTVGIIDSDYYNNLTNEGHIFIKLTNDGHEGKCIDLNAGNAYAQGIFVEYGITENDEALLTRKGGVGSTSQRL